MSLRTRTSSVLIPMLQKIKTASTTIFISTTYSPVYGLTSAPSLHTVSLLLLLLLSTLFSPALTCPPSCECTKKNFVEVACKDGQLLDIFTQIDPRTYQLTLDNVDDLSIIAKSRIGDLKAPSIVKLRITSSSVKSIGAHAFEKLTLLEELDLSVNELMSLQEDSFGDLQELKFLNLSQNRLATLGQSLTPLAKLITLDVSLNSLKDLPTGLFKSQSALTTLKLDGNPLKNLYGHSFVGLKNLREFRGRDCSLIHVEEAVFTAMPSLAVLDLGRNRLISVPYPAALARLGLLKTIYFDSNEIQMLNKNTFTGLHLQTIDLSYNRISKIENLAFYEANLREVDLSYNLIISLNRTVLAPLNNHITKLNLAGNPLQKLQEDVFSNLKLLDTLNMSSCSLKTLQAGIIKALPVLRLLDISQNSLPSLAESLLQHFEGLDMIVLHENAWVCDCQIKPLRDWLKLASHASKIHCPSRQDGQIDCSNLRCVSPPDLQNSQISRLEDKELAKCEHEKSSALPAGTQGAIVASCMGFAVVLLIVTIYLWRRGKTHHGLKRVCVPSAAQSSRIEEDDEDEKPPPLANCQRNSLTLSDHNFVFRHYFDHLVTDPKLMADDVEDEEEEDEVGGASGHKERDSLYSSQPSLYSNHSDAGYGMESTV